MECSNKPAQTVPGQATETANWSGTIIMNTVCTCAEQVRVAASVTMLSDF